MDKPTSWISNLFFLGIAAGLSLGIGTLFNISQRNPLPLHYVSLQERLIASNARLKTNELSLDLPRDQPSSLSAAHAIIPIEREELQIMQAEETCILIDARPNIFYNFGHIPGAQNLPRDDYEAVLSDLLPTLQGSSKHIVVYCSGWDCQDSKLIARALSNLALGDIYIYTGGWEDWESAGLPQATSEPLPSQ